MEPDKFKEVVEGIEKIIDEYAKEDEETSMMIIYTAPTGTSQIDEIGLNKPMIGWAGIKGIPSDIATGLINMGHKNPLVSQVIDYLVMDRLSKLGK